jgi:hypothetical protein
MDDSTRGLTMWLFAVAGRVVLLELRLLGYMLCNIPDAAYPPS